MDPNLFHLDWERTFEVLAKIVVLANRAAASVEGTLVFESDGHGITKRWHSMSER